MSNYLGKKISLISKAGIRYEGILYTIDPTESTVALSKVKSFGTEDRGTERFIPARDEVYEYIIFRGSDISDLRVCGNSLYTDDSAIVKIVSPSQSAPATQEHGDTCSTSTLDDAYISSKFTCHPSPAAPTATAAASTPMMTVSNAPRTVTPNKQQHSESSDDNKRHGGNRNRQHEANNMDKIASDDFQTFMSREHHSSGAYTDYGGYQSQHHNQGQQQYSRRDYDYYAPRRSYNRSRGGGNRSSTGQFQQYDSGVFGLPGGGSGHRNVSSHKDKQEAETIKDDFDFDKSNALLADELAALGVDEKQVQAMATQSTTEGEDGPISEDGQDETAKPYYDKSKSFFDNISSERQASISERRGDRRVNQETFGGDSGESRRGGGGQYHNNRGWGNYRRGYNRGGGGYGQQRGGGGGGMMGFSRRGNFASRGGGGQAYSSSYRGFSQSRNRVHEHDYEMAGPTVVSEGRF